MKIGTFIPTADNKIEGIKIFKPIQSLLVVFNYASENPVGLQGFLSCAAKVAVSLQDSAKGSNEVIIPYVGLNNLSEIATFNEGHVISEGKHIIFPVMLNPIGNVILSNDKYLELDMIDITTGVGNPTSVDIYGYEGSNNNEFLAKYMKISAPGGVSRHKINVADSDLASFPISGFDSIRIQYKNGIISELSPIEMSYQMAKTNDMTFVGRSSDGTGSVKILSNVVGAGPTVLNQVNLVTSYVSRFILNLDKVESIEILRDSDSVNSYEFILGDFIK